MTVSLGAYKVTQSDLECARNPACDIQTVLSKMGEGGNDLASMLSLDLDNANVVPDMVKNPDGTFDWTKILIPVAVLGAGLLILNRVIK